MLSARHTGPIASKLFAVPTGFLINKSVRIETVHRYVMLGPKFKPFDATNRDSVQVFFSKLASLPLLINPAYYHIRNIKKRDDPAKDPWSGWDGDMGGLVGSLKIFWDGMEHMERDCMSVLIRMAANYLEGERAVELAKPVNERNPTLKCKEGGFNSHEVVNGVMIWTLR
jgi:hypothetical protein